MSWRLVYTKQAQKDAEKLAGKGNGKGFLPGVVLEADEPVEGLDMLPASFIN